MDRGKAKARSHVAGELDDLVLDFGPAAVRDAALKSLGYPADLIHTNGEILKLKTELEQHGKS